MIYHCTACQLPDLAGLGGLMSAFVLCTQAMSRTAASPGALAGPPTPSRLQLLLNTWTTMTH